MTTRTQSDNMQAEKMLNVRLPVEVASQLEALTKATGRTKSALTVAALRNYLAVEAWQIAEIEAGLEEATRSDFAPESEVNAFFAKHGC